MPASAICARRLARPVRLLALALALVVLAAVVPRTRAFECSACQYTARHCSMLESETTAAATSDSVAVCDAAGKIVIDDVFCDNNECQCASDKRCASLVIGCTNVFQARSRKRCIGLDAEQRRFQKCAVAQGLTTLNTTGLSADWVYFKDPAQCVSSDCAAVQQFHASGVVQCGYLLVAWKDSDALFHFVVDGSRARDMAPGVFHYAVPFDRSSTGGSQLVVASVRETRVERCYALQTRNDRSACDGYYIQYDTAVQLSSDDYQLSKLSWPIWIAVVGSVLAATVAVAGVALAAYRFRRMDLGDGADDCELLQTQQLDAADAVEPTATTSTKNAAAAKRQDLRLRTLSPRSSDDGDGLSASANSV